MTRVKHWSIANSTTHLNWRCYQQRNLYIKINHILIWSIILKNWHVLLPGKDLNLVANEKRNCFETSGNKYLDKHKPKRRRIRENMFHKNPWQKDVFPRILFVGTRHDPMCCQLGNQLFERKHPGRGRMVKKETYVWTGRKSEVIGFCMCLYYTRCFFQWEVQKEQHWPLGRSSRDLFE